MAPIVVCSCFVFRNAEKCLVFVAFINQGWCKSAECDWEFNIALAHSLKSNTRTPYIIPILLEEFAFYSEYLPFNKPPPTSITVTP